MKDLNQKDKTKFKVSTLCKVLNVSRNSYVNFVKRGGCDQDLNEVLVAKIEEVVTSSRKYGYRRVTAALRKSGLLVNHKKVLCLMRTKHLLCKVKQAFKSTTDSNHSLPKYPNLLTGFTPTGVNQVWASDITYVRLKNGFVYLAVVMDLFSRKVVGWAISRYIDEQLTLCALNMALASRQVPKGLIHHSDQGVQYASLAYTNRLKECGIRISMSRKANPYDNAYLESFMKTLKQEEVYANEYESLADVSANMGKFIEEIYNTKRLHSSLGYMSPTEYEFAYSSVSFVSSFAVPK